MCACRMYDNLDTQWTAVGECQFFAAVEPFTFVGWLDLMAYQPQ